MNLERAYPIWFVACAAVGAAIGKAAGQDTVQGLVAGMLVAVLPVVILGLAHLLLSLWRPVLPACRCGQCNHKDYRLVTAPSADDVAGRSTVRFQCPRCDRLYEFSSGRLDELAGDGRVVPFMRHTKWGRWRKAEAATSAE